MKRLNWTAKNANGVPLIDEARDLWRRHGVKGAAAELSRKLGQHVSPATLNNALCQYGRGDAPKPHPVGNVEPQQVPIAPPPTTPAAPVAPEQAEPGRGAFDPSDDREVLRAENRDLLAEVTRLRKSALTEERVRRELLRLAAAPVSVPAWLADVELSPAGSYGVPTLFGSDEHFGEVVDPTQIGGVNEYNLEIARRRWKRCTEKTISLCFNFLARPQFDGIVAAQGGDGVSGNIHDELIATNEKDIGPIVLEYADLLVWKVRELKRAFGRVFVPCVIGNHARMSAKPRAKGAAFTSFDWIAYHIAAREFAEDPDVHFLIPNGEDASYRIFGHRFVLTHGAQFRGGDGIIGPLGPVFRGDNKKRARNAQVGLEYDTLLVAHFHQLRQDRRLCMNGSLKGYDEYAYRGNFAFEPPQQALFVTHPRMGITFSFPVMVEDPPARDAESWVQWDTTSTEAA